MGMKKPLQCSSFIAYTQTTVFLVLALKHTLKLFNTGSSVFVKVEFLISISLLLLGAFSKNAEKPFLLLFFWCSLVIVVFL